MNQAWLGVAAIALSLLWLLLWLVVTFIIGKIKARTFHEAFDDHTIQRRAGLIALAMTAIMGMTATGVSIDTHDFIGLISILGLLGTVMVAASWWEQQVYRLVPFAYATTLALGWFWEKPALELLKGIVVMNAVAGVLLLALWLEIRFGIQEKSGPG